MKNLYVNVSVGGEWVQIGHIEEIEPGKFRLLVSDPAAFSVLGGNIQVVGVVNSEPINYVEDVPYVDNDTAITYTDPAVAE